MASRSAPRACAKSTSWCASCAARPASERYPRAVQFAQIGRQTRIVINNRVNDFIPNPTFERVAAPGAHEKFFAGENTEGLTLREMQGKAIEAPEATRNPIDRLKE